MIEETRNWNGGKACKTLERKKSSKRRATEKLKTLTWRDRPGRRGRGGSGGGDVVVRVVGVIIIAVAIVGVVVIGGAPLVRHSGGGRGVRGPAHEAKERRGDEKSAA